VIERSSSQVVHSIIDVNLWAERLPAVDEVRPARCPSCDLAGRPLGAPLGIVGHGTRARQVRGPASVGRLPVLRQILVRRYRCRGCSAILVVVPLGILDRRHFGASAIALALFRFGGGTRVVEIRREVGGYGDTAAWPTLRRWVRAAGQAQLWGCVRASPPEWGRRQVAQRVAMTLVAHAPPLAGEASLDARVFAGAAHAA
jgi:hypothetical protein